MMRSTGYPSGTQVEVKYLGDDLPAIVGADERQEVREELRANRTFGAHERECRTSELDRYDPVVPWLPTARRRRPCVDDGEVLGHCPIGQCILGWAHVVRLWMEHPRQPRQIAVVQAVEILAQHLHDGSIRFVHPRPRHSRASRSPS